MISWSGGLTADILRLPSDGTATAHPLGLHVGNNDGERTQGHHHTDQKFFHSSSSEK
jgi:hypothetical protein